MALSLVAVGAKITAAITNSIINVVNAQGLTGIIPTSVAGTGVSVGANGSVTFTGASAVSLNGCFTTSYDNYIAVLVITGITGGAPVISARVRASGTDLTTSYDRLRISSSSSTSTVTTVAGVTQLDVSDNSVGNVGKTRFEFISPNLTTQTNILANSSYYNTASGALIKNELEGWVRNTLQYDGFTVFPASGTITGTLRVYGYNNN